MRGERGSVLALVPAGFLVLMTLGALAVDTATAYQAQQQLRDALAAAANDAVAAAVDDRAFYGSGAVVLDPAAVGAEVCRSVLAQKPAALHDLRLAVAVSRQSVLVTGSADVDAVFGRSLPGVGTHAVRAHAAATLERTATPAAPAGFGPPVPISCGQ
jgi:hypothetical protein